MSTTRAAIRRRAVGLARTNGRSRGFASRNNSAALTSTGGAATTLIDTAGLPPTGAAATTGKGNWLFLPSMTAANQKRLISLYTGSSKQFTHQGPDYDATTITALGTGTPYLVLKDDPDLWDSAINEALQELLSQVVYDEITLTSSTIIRYTLSAAPFTLTGIVRDSQVAEIEYRDANDAAGEENWKPWADGSRTWKTYMDESNVILDFGEVPPTTSYKLRVKWTKQFTIPAAETTAIDVDEYWAALATLCVMADWLADPDNPSDDWNMIGRRVRTQYVGQRRGILGEDAFRSVQRSAQTAAVGGVRGRAGRGR